MKNPHDLPGGIPQWTLGDRLRKARTAAGLERHELADDIGVSLRTVSNYENDQTRAPKLVISLYALRTGVPIAWIMTGITPDGGGGDGTPIDLPTGREVRSVAALRLVAA